VRPDIAMHMMLALAVAGDGAPVVLSTSARERRSGTGYVGPPRNPAHVRGGKIFGSGSRNTVAILILVKGAKDPANAGCTLHYPLHQRRMAMGRRVPHLPAAAPRSPRTDMTRKTIQTTRKEACPARSEPART
jgi:hypothetical protein